MDPDGCTARFTVYTLSFDSPDEVSVCARLLLHRSLTSEVVDVTCEVRATVERD